MAISNLTPEIRDVPEFLGYGVSADGRAWCRLRRGRLPRGCISRLGDTWRELKQVRDPDGYLQISVVRDGRVTTPRVHRMVLIAFVGPRPEDEECRHLDGNRANNRLENLAWGTRKENAGDKWVHGTMAYGERSPNAILTDEEVRQVRRLLTQGKTQERVAQQLGVSEPAISAIATGRNWKHVK
jgi:hypothetical protein